jgi:hypothetical protein
MNEPPRIKLPTRHATNCWNQSPYSPAYNLSACKGPSCTGPFTYFVAWDAWYGEEQFGSGALKGGSSGV